MSKSIGCCNVDDPISKDNILNDIDSCKNLSQNGYQGHTIVEKRSSLNRQLEINMTPKMTQLNNSNPDGLSKNTSRYGRARKQKTVTDFYPTDIAFQIKSRMSKSPSKSPKKSSSSVKLPNTSPKTASRYEIDTRHISSNEKGQNLNIEKNNTELKVTYAKTEVLPESHVSANENRSTSFEKTTIVPWNKTINSKPLKVYVKKDMIQKKPEPKPRSVFQNFLLLCKTTHDSNNSLPTDNDDSVKISSPILQNINSPLSKKSLSLKNKTNLAEKSFDRSDISRRSEVEELGNSQESSCESTKVEKTTEDKIAQISISNDKNSLNVDDQKNNELKNQQIDDYERSCTWQLGELLWARVGSHPFWPCLVTRDPFSLEFVIKKKIGRSTDCVEVYHVTYFGDNGRRSWVVSKNLIKFEGLDKFYKLKDQFNAETKKKYGNNAFDVKSNQKSKWCSAVEEAEMVMQRPPDMRVDFFYENLSCLKLSKKKERTEKKKLQKNIIDQSSSEYVFNSLFNTSSEINGLNVSHGESINNKNNLDVGDLLCKNLDSLEASVECDKVKIQSHMDKWLLKAKKPVIPTTRKDIHDNDSVPVETSASLLTPQRVSLRRKSFSNALHVIQDNKKRNFKNISKRRQSVANFIANDSPNEVVKLVGNSSLNGGTSNKQITQMKDSKPAELNSMIDNDNSEEPSMICEDASPVTLCISNINVTKGNTVDKWLLKAKKPVIPTRRKEIHDNDSVPVETSASLLTPQRVSLRRKSFSNALHVIQDNKKRNFKNISKRRQSVANFIANDSPNEVVKLVGNSSLNGDTSNKQIAQMKDSKPAELNNTIDNENSEEPSMICEDASPVTSFISNINSTKGNTVATGKTSTPQGRNSVENSTDTNAVANDKTSMPQRRNSVENSTDTNAVANDKTSMPQRRNSVENSTDANAVANDKTSTPQRRNSMENSTEANAVADDKTSTPQGRNSMENSTEANAVADDKTSTPQGRNSVENSTDANAVAKDKTSTPQGRNSVENSSDPIAVANDKTSTPQRRNSMENSTEANAVADDKTSTPQGRNSVENSTDANAVAKDKTSTPQGRNSVENSSDPIAVVDDKTSTPQWRNFVENSTEAYAVANNKTSTPQRRNSVENLTEANPVTNDKTSTPQRRNLVENSTEGNTAATGKISMPRRRNSVQKPYKKKQTLNGSLDLSNVDSAAIMVKNLDSSAVSKTKSRRKSVSCQKILDSSTPNKNTSDQNDVSLSSDRKISSLNRRATIDCRYAIDTDRNDKTLLNNTVEDSLSASKNTKNEVYNNRYNDPEFIEFVEFKRDTLLEENPDMTEESQMSYLYKTWQYGKSKESDDRKIGDDYCLVKGMSDEPNASETKRLRKNNDIKEVKTDIKEVKATSSPRLDKSLRKKNIKTYIVGDSDSEPEAVDTLAQNQDIEELNENELESNTTGDKIFTENHSTPKSVQKVNKKLKEKCAEVQEIKNQEKEKVSVSDYYMELLKQVKPNIFRGLQKEKVCGICEKPSGLVKCNGPCGEVYHVACVEKQNLSPTTQGSNRYKRKKKRGRKKIITGEDKSILLESSLVFDDLDDRENDSNNFSLMIPPDLEDDKELPTLQNTTVKDLLTPDSLVIEAQKFELVEKKIQEMIKTDNSEAELDISLTSIDTEHEWSGVNAGECVIVDITKHKNKPTPVETKTNDVSENTKLFKCNDCLKYDKPLCFICKSTCCAKNGSEIRQKCNVNHCNKYYHIECLDPWPQTRFSSGCPTKSQKMDNIAESFSCPRHRCHTCISDNPQNSQTRFSGDKLARCVRCPATYNCFTKCVPAGTRVLTATQIVCPKHSDDNKIPYHVNTSWCFICTRGGSLICCETCPISIHPECLKITPPEGGYICEDCETGRLPLYEEIVWVKLGRYRWWPALILHPADIPSNIAALPHASNHFAVRFFGDYDHFWVDKGRVFPFQEDDSVTLANTSTKKSAVDTTFITAMEQAKKALNIIKTMKKHNVEEEELASSMLPPQYVKLKVNRPVGAVRNYQNNESNAQKCECDPKAENPCGPESHCLNRILLTECSPSVCAAGENCCNQAFEKRQYPLLAPSKTQSRGWGLQTLVDIKKGDFVIEYVGEIIDEAEFQRRMARMREYRDENYYFLTLDKDRMIDAGPKGNVARFMNHSCEPNCETQKWTVNGDTRVGLFALEDIPAGSEVTFNYNLMSADDDKRKCMCGAKRCAGYIGAKIKQVDSIAKSSKKATPKRKYNKKNADGTKKTSTKSPINIAKKRKLTPAKTVQKKANVDKDSSLLCDTPSNISRDVLNSSNEESRKENLPIDNCPESKASLSIVLTSAEYDSYVESNPLLEPVMQKPVTEHQTINDDKVKNKRARAKSVYYETDHKASAVIAKKDRYKRHSIDHGVGDICDEAPKAKRGRPRRSLPRSEVYEI